MIELVQNSRFEVNTPTGFKSFSGIRRTTKSEVVCITFEDGKSLKSSLDHRFVVEGREVFAKDIKEKTYLSKTKLVKSIKKEPYNNFLYDLVNVGDDSLYLVEDVVSHNCDFSTSGDTVIEPTTLNYYQETTVKDPVERSGPNQALWLWEYPDLLKTYMIVADVARGDGKDFSTYHIIEIETLIQVGEFRDQLPTKDFARGLVAKAIEWNNALLIVENASIGWDVVTTIEEIGYPNLYYSPKSELVGTQIDQYVSRFDKGDGMVPGFGMNQRTRPLVVEKGRSFIEERSVVIRSQRTMDELRVFIWKNSKPQAMQGYNDDLVMPLLTGLFLRDTALRFRKVAFDLTYASLSSFSKTGNNFEVYSSVQHGRDNPWQMQIGDQQSDLTWLL